MRGRTAWAWLAMSAAAVPFLTGLSGSRVFYVRDLSLFFWGRFLWLRHEIWSGTFPFWDPYIGAGQSAVADALHQLFLPPALAIRFIGGDVLGFNLWVAAPFPLAALGAWLFLARRFSARASALGAIAFALSGPIFSTSNFPNLSWSAAAIPWVLCAADHAASRLTLRSIALLAIAVALQALAGEPVTLLATAVLTLAFVLMVSTPPAAAMRHRLTIAAVVGVGFTLGIGIAAVQLLPLARAAALSERAATIRKDFWSIHPMALLETIALHVYGDYYTVQSLRFAPWLPPLNSGREPFLFSLYLGVPLLTLAVFGLVAGRRTRWALFWAGTATISVMFALGGHSPVYPFVRDHLPVLGSFRFPAKYLVVSSMALAAAAAAGWDALAEFVDARDGSTTSNHGRLIALALPAAVGISACVAAAFCMYFPQVTVFRFFTLARHLHAEDPVEAAAFMLRTLPRAASLVLLMSAATVVVAHLSTAKRAAAAPARAIWYGMIVIDLLVHTWGINPVFDPAYLAEPAWLSPVKAHPDSRLYVGGKREGTLDPGDLDSGGGYLNPLGLTGSASRAALSGEADFYPSAWRVREMLSYDLPVLWPKEFTTMTDRFLLSGRGDRDRFLDRTGVRFRVLPRSQAGGRTAIAQVPYLVDSFLFDAGDGVAPRVSVISRSKIVSDVDAQIEALFDPSWDQREVVLVDRDADAAGDAGSPVPPSARITTESANRVVVEAGVPADGGHLVLLDSYSADWKVTVDAWPATLTRADGMFRAVRLAPGRHVVEFVYRPKAFFAGLGVSVVALMLVAGLFVWPTP